MNNNDTCDGTFTEIFAPLNKKEQPRFIKALISKLDDPKHCSELIKALDYIFPIRERNKDKDNSIDQSILQNEYPIGHLRRVRRVVEKPDKHKDNNMGDRNLEESTPTRKRKRKNKEEKIELEILISSSKAIERIGDEQLKKSLSDIVTRFNLKLEERLLPGHPADSKEELEEFNQIWPTLYFHEQTYEHRKTERALSHEEIQQMTQGINFALEDASLSKAQYERWVLSNRENRNNKDRLVLGGVIVLDPLTGRVVSRSSDERGMLMQSQDKSPEFPDQENPLCTPILLALQGISRKERDLATGLGMNSPEFANGQYLCTGFDVYSVIEPDVFEAMSLVHARVRRVIFGLRDKNGGLGGSDEKITVHELPGTNHHYRAFLVVDKSVNEKCINALK